MDKSAQAPGSRLPRVTPFPLSPLRKASIQGRWLLGPEEREQEVRSQALVDLTWHQPRLPTMHPRELSWTAGPRGAPRLASLPPDGGFPPISAAAPEASASQASGRGASPGGGRRKLFAKEKSTPSSLCFLISYSRPPWGRVSIITALYFSLLKLTWERRGRVTL